MSSENILLILHLTQTLIKLFKKKVQLKLTNRCNITHF